MRKPRPNLLSNLNEYRLALLAGGVGLLAMLLSLVSYYIASSNLIVNPVTDEQLQAPATATLIAFLLGLVSLVCGVHLLFRQERRRQESRNIEVESKFAVLVRALSSRPYNILFVTSALLYGVLFAIVSGQLVYQPGLSEGLGASPPVAFLVTCCDPFGQTPRLVVYLTSNLGALLVPLNILLLTGTSWMVGANISVAGFAYKTRAMTGSLRWLGGFGATTGLLTACPTCASLLLLGAAGGGDALAALFSSAQPALVLGTIVLLSANLALMAGRLLEAKKCDVPGKSTSA
jgi:hypothetical protein